MAGINRLSLKQKKYIAGNYLFLLPFLLFFFVFTLGPILYAINKPIKAKNTYRFIFYIPVVFSVPAMGIVMGWTFDTHYGIINAITGSVGIPQINWLGDQYLVIPTLSLASIWWCFGGPMLIFLAAMQNLPISCFEAAKIAGAKSYQIFFRITVPLMAPAILFIIITQFIAHLQVFGQPYVMTAGGGPGRASYTAILYLYHTAWRYYRMGYGTSIAVSLALIILVITAIQLILGSHKARVEY